MTEKIEESQEFATQVQREVYSRLVKAGSKQRNRGVKKAPFVVLIGANMPSILAEISFLTNPYDERLMKRADYRERIADALYRGIARYVDKLGGVRAMQQASTGESPTASASNF
jgi:N-acetylmuramoyl-L-alanine amidase